MSEGQVGLSVVVCTRDRAIDLERCVRALAALRPRPLELIVIDQGSSPATLPPVPFTVHHVRTTDRGLSRARNLGRAKASSDLVAFVDDDCTVAPGWAADVAGVFERHKDAGLVFGSVLSAAPVESAYVPVYAVDHERRLTGRLSARRAHGIGAAMYLRLSMAARVGDFDTHLGAGGEFRSSEDWDFTFRALAAGVVVVETPAVRVTHFGARDYASRSAAEMLRWNAFSHGAVHAKLLRCGDPIAAVLIGAELAAMTAIARPWNAVRRRPTNLARGLMYARGLAAGFRAPVIRERRLFGPPSRALGG